MRIKDSVWVVILSVFPLLVPAQGTFDPSFLEKIIDSEMETAESKWNFRTSAATDDYDLTYLRAEWMIDPEIFFISGTVTYYFRTKSELSQITFDLSDSLQTCGIVFRNTTTSVLPAGNLLSISLAPHILAAGTIDSITICYSGKPAGSGFGSFAQSGHQGDSIIWTLSEPYGASDWFPAKNSLNDKIDSADILLHIPASCRGGSNGKLILDQSDGINRVMHWKHRFPIATYLVGVAVTNYSQIVEYAELSNGDQVEILNYIYPEDSAYYAENPGRTAEMLRLFSYLFGDYPFKSEKYGHAQFNWGGGIEHQTMSFVYFPNMFELAAHELAHQWFGNKITCGSWSDIWLNEGFATYLSGLCYENILPEYWYSFKLTQQGRAYKDSVNSVFCDDTSNVGRIFNGSISYAKAAYVLHMLRFRLGDDLFFEALNHYLNDPELSYGFARTGQLQEHLEQVYGQPLDEFFKDWVYGKGYPSYQVRWAASHDGRVFLILNQTQNNPVVEFFEMGVPLHLKGPEGDTIITVNHALNGEQFILGPFDFAVDSIRVDPNLEVLIQRKTVVNDPSMAMETVLYPNPVSSSFSINWFNREAPLQTILIYDASGRRISEITCSGNWTFENEVVDVSNFSPGVYLVDLIDTAGDHTLEQLLKF